MANPQPSDPNIPPAPDTPAPDTPAPKAAPPRPLNPEKNDTWLDGSGELYVFDGTRWEPYISPVSGTDPDPVAVAALIRDSLAKLIRDSADGTADA